LRPGWRIAPAAWFIPQSVGAAREQTAGERDAGDLLTAAISEFEGVVVAVAAAAERGDCTGPADALGIADREVLGQNYMNR
jgi:hypothetical protein